MPQNITLNAPLALGDTEDLLCQYPRIASESGCLAPRDLTKVCQPACHQLKYDRCWMKITGPSESYEDRPDIFIQPALNVKNVTSQQQFPCPWSMSIKVTPHNITTPPPECPSQFHLYQRFQNARRLVHAIITIAHTNLENKREPIFNIFYGSDDILILHQQVHGLMWER